MYTLVTRVDLIEDKYPGGLTEYKKSPYVWHDDFIVGTSYMNILDVEAHVSHLAKYFTCFDDSQTSKNVAILDQMRGILTGCDWLNFGRNSQGQSICWLIGQKPGEVVMPTELND